MKNTKVEVGGIFVQENESFKWFLKSLTPIIIDKKDDLLKKTVEYELIRLGVNVENLGFHEGANHLVWKKDNLDFVVVMRHWQKNE